jgi:flagellar basal-body rod protein FlgB
MNQLTTFQLLERYLDLASERHQLIVNNMANIDTPGYRTRDLDFRQELQRVIAGGDPSATPVLRQVSGLAERPDGNNVSLEREGLLLSEAQLQFRMGVQLIRREFSRLLTAINGGGTSSS